MTFSSAETYSTLGYVDWVNGSIDDVRLYQAALTPDQILAIARIGDPSLPGPQPVQPATLDVGGFHPGAHINPKFYGLMTEEINHSYDGGIYGELVQNPVFKDDPSTPVARLHSIPLSRSAVQL
jgi:hypothetical protein